MDAVAKKGGGGLPLLDHESSFSVTVKDGTSPNRRFVATPSTERVRLV